MRTTIALAVFALLALTGPVVKAQNATFPNIMAALTGSNLTGLASLVRLAGLDQDLSDPTLNITLFAPSNAAVASATAQLASQMVNVTEIIPIILLYHASPNVTINFSDEFVLPTYLAGANITNTTTTLTVIQETNNTYYIGGIIGGAEFNISSKITAGMSNIYVINSVLVPPSSLFGVPLTISQAVATTPGFSILGALIGNDSAIANATADPTLGVTVFAPTDAAFNAAFRALNVSLAKIVGTPLARTILLNHIYPDLPIVASDIPLGSTTVGSASPNDTITVTKTLNGTNATITVRGAGNTAPIPVLVPDVPAGISSIFVIGGVILPKFNTTSNATTSM